MKLVLKLEELAMAAGAVYLLGFHSLGLPIWAWILLFFAPDISMAGYAGGARSGALLYNLFHHKGFAMALGAVGYFQHWEVLLSIGILLFAHASFDRIWGYGLKYATGFSNTHLGSLEGREKSVAGAKPFTDTAHTHRSNA